MFGFDPVLGQDKCDPIITDISIEPDILDRYVCFLYRERRKKKDSSGGGQQPALPGLGVIVGVAEAIGNAFGDIAEALKPAEDTKIEPPGRERTARHTNEYMRGQR